MDHYLVFQGAGIGGAVEIPATLAGCANPVFITIGPLNAHDDQHTIDWVDCRNIERRWVLAVPVANRWLAGTPQPVASPSAEEPRDGQTKALHVARVTLHTS